MSKRAARSSLDQSASFCASMSDEENEVDVEEEINCDAGQKQSPVASKKTRDENATSAEQRLGIATNLNRVTSVQMNRDLAFIEKTINSRHMDGINKLFGSLSIGETDAPDGEEENDNAGADHNMEEAQSSSDADAMLSSDEKNVAVCEDDVDAQKAVLDKPMQVPDALMEFVRSRMRHYGFAEDVISARRLLPEPLIRRANDDDEEKTSASGARDIGSLFEVTSVPRLISITLADAFNMMLELRLQPGTACIGEFMRLFCTTVDMPGVWDAYMAVSYAMDLASTIVMLPWVFTLRRAAACFLRAQQTRCVLTETDVRAYADLFLSESFVCEQRDQFEAVVHALVHTTQSKAFALLAAAEHVPYTTRVHTLMLDTRTPWAWRSSALVRQLSDWLQEIPCALMLMHEHEQLAATRCRMAFTQSAQTVVDDYARFIASAMVKCTAFDHVHLEKTGLLRRRAPVLASVPSDLLEQGDLGVWTDAVRQWRPIPHLGSPEQVPAGQLVPMVLRADFELLAGKMDELALPDLASVDDLVEQHRQFTQRLHCLSSSMSAEQFHDFLNRCRQLVARQ
jgi:hypothetical protein